MNLRRLIATLGALVALCSVVFAVPAAQAQDAGFLQVRAVDNSTPATVAMNVSFSGSAEELENATIVENGEEVSIDSVVPAAEAGVEPVVVLAIDSAEGVDRSMAGIRRAATAVVDTLPAGTPIAVVTFSDGALVNRRFTTDPALVNETIDGLVADGATALWDGLLASAELIGEDVGDRQPNVVLVTASGDEASVTTFGRAAGELETVASPVWVVGVETGRYDPASMQALVDRAGGRVASGAETTAMAEIGADMAETVTGQYVVTYERPSLEGDAAGTGDITIEVGDLSTAASYVPGSFAEGASALAPIEGSSGGFSLFQGSLGKILVLLLVMAAVGTGAYAVILLFQSDDAALSSVLQPYADGFVDPNAPDEGAMAKTAILQRAVDMTEDFAEKQGFLARTESTLEQADMPLRAAEALFFYGAGLLVTAALAFVLTGNILGALVATLLVGVLPLGIVSYKARKRRKKFEAQLPDTLTLLSGTLRAGYSLMQGVEAVSQEVEDPIGQELRRVVTEARLGRPLEESLDASALRMNSADFSWAVMAIGIQREVGGNLAELLLTVAETMTARERLRRDVAALTAEGKVSAIVLGLLPLALSGAMFVVNPDYIGLLFTEKVGNAMLIGSVILACIGFYWMKKTIEIEI